MSAPLATPPPVGPGTIPALIEFLRTLPPSAGAVSWAARDEGDGTVWLTLDLTFPLPDSWQEVYR